MMSEPGLIFDFDGVIVLSEPVHIRSWDDLADHFDRPLPENFGFNGIGRSDRVLCDELSRIWDGDLSGEKVLKAKRHFYRLRTVNESRIVPGAIEALEHFAKRYQIALATSSSIGDIELLLAHHDLERFFDSMLTAESIERPKPEPDIYHKAAKSLGREANECWVFEDSIQGVTAARKSGARVIGITTTFDAPELPPLDAHFPDFCDLNSIAKIIESNGKNGSRAARESRPASDG